MITNIEFLGEEPIENVITCMHYKMDKVIFFGYQDVIQVQKTRTDHFLGTYCGVQEVVYQALPENALQTVLEEMRKIIEYELSQGNKIYFDITGGESLILVAFGILSKEYDTPIHQYDIVEDKMTEFSVGTASYLSMDVPAQKVEWNLDRYIELHGGIINYDKHKALKDLEDPEFAQDVAVIWKISRKYGDYWNAFSELLRAHLIPDAALQVRQDVGTILKALEHSTGNLKTVRVLNNIIDDLAEAGLLLDMEHQDGRYRFRFKNQMIKDCLWESGSILELHIFREARMQCDDCRIGVYLDWDGIIMPQGEAEVVNEIDILSLSGNVATFLSCKSGNMKSHQILHAFYELETITRRFGGKYARKVLVTAKPLGKSYQERAKEMKIEIQTVEK